MLISSFQVGQEIGIQSILTNREAHDQRFAYVVEAIDKNHVLDYFEGFSASMLSNQSFTATQVWTPTEAGNYTVQVSVNGTKYNYVFDFYKEPYQIQVATLRPIDEGLKMIQGDFLNGTMSEEREVPFLNATKN